MSARGRGEPTGRIGLLWAILVLTACQNKGGTSAAAEGLVEPASEDTTAPRLLRLARADGAGPLVANRAVALQVDGEDDVGIASVCLSDRAARAATCRPWQPWTERPSVTLGTLQGPLTVRAWARDAAGNASAPLSLPLTLDTRAPTGGTMTVAPQPGGVRLQWSGVSDATSGVASYTVFARKGALAPRCSASTPAWTGTRTEATLTGISSELWTFTLCATDAAGNVSAGLVARGHGEREDDPPVVRALSINGGAAYSGSRDVTVDAEVTDASGVTRMCFAEADLGAAGCAAWQPFAARSPLTLSGGSEDKTVYAWFEDVHGNRSPEAASATITFDWLRPENGDLEIIPGLGQAQLRWSGFTDATSGVARYIVVSGADRAPASCAEGDRFGSTTGESITVTGLAAGRVGFRVCAEDHAGNVSTGASGRVTLLAEYDPPTLVEMVLNEGQDATATRAVRLQLSAADPAGVAEMCVSDTASCSLWRPFSADSTFTLSAGAGWRTVSVWLRDSLGNESPAPATARVELGPDADADGFIASRDCDDGDALRSPVAAERCDGQDDDCDGVIDEDDAIDAILHYEDRDGDGHGAGLGARSCAAPAGWTATADDCDDADADAHPGATEACDGEDDDCDGAVDEAVQCACEAVPLDEKTLYVCEAPLSWSEADARCAEDGLRLASLQTADEGAEATDRAEALHGDPALWAGGSAEAGAAWAWADDSDWTFAAWSPAPPPSALDRCLGLGAEGAWSAEDCTQARPFLCQDATLQTYFADEDNDGHGNPSEPITASSLPTGAAEGEDDCDDDDARRRPAMEETCDGVDEDCDGLIDEGCAAVLTIPDAGLPAPEGGATGACGHYAQTGLSHNPHDINTMYRSMDQLNGVGAPPRSAVARVEPALDFTCSCNNTWGLCAPGNYTATTRPWPVSSPTGGNGAARFRGYLVVTPDMLNATIGLMGNDSARLLIAGQEIAWVSWGSGGWKKFRWVAFAAPGLYPFELQWQTNQGYDLDPLEVVWGPGFLPGMQDYQPCCHTGITTPPLKFTPIPGLEIVAGPELLRSTTGADTVCQDCDEDADCGVGACNSAGLCE